VRYSADTGPTRRHDVVVEHQEGLASIALARMVARLIRKAAEGLVLSEIKRF
jgi:hypothetical protein